ncbi:glutamate ABC transporter substrate-binding protein [Sciscionella sediminilitoris]|uniref:glutamate ABC transporter substrate-binding protein n=1 Tax=Sciscionella sediminilitoris TaxID=1445613 RepID=UPI000561C89A|nr:glutamate ABC transporter substrate-binding protein [Sciscionella sp. SE31]
MRARPFAGAFACGLLLTVTGCAGMDRPVDISAVPPAKDPLGQLVGAKAVPADSGTDTSCGDPTVSQRPPDKLPEPGKMPRGSTMARIAQRGYLTAGVDQTTYLFGYRNPRSGVIEGFDIDVVHAIAKALFGDRDRVRFVVINSDQRVPALRSGKVDVVVRTMTTNCARKKQIGLSSVYYTAAQRLLVDKASGAKSLADLGGRKVCAAKGSTSLRTIANTPGKPVPVAVNDWADCLVLLQQGDVAGISTDDSILAGMAAQDPKTAIVGPKQESEPYAVGVGKQNGDLVRFVNGVLDQFREQTWPGSYARWIGDRLGPQPEPPAPHYPGAGKPPKET